MRTFFYSAMAVLSLLAKYVFPVVPLGQSYEATTLSAAHSMCQSPLLSWTPKCGEVNDASQLLWLVTAAFVVAAAVSFVLNWLDDWKYGS